MSAISVVAVLTTGIAIGAAGHAALTTTPESAHLAAAAAPAAKTSPAPRVEAQAVPFALPQSREAAQPRECRPEDGIVTDCSYE
jgi:hypothetical protein